MGSRESSFLPGRGRSLLVVGVVDDQGGVDVDVQPVPGNGGGLLPGPHAPAVAGDSRAGSEMRDVHGRAGRSASRIACGPRLVPGRRHSAAGLGDARSEALWRCLRIPR